MIYQGRVHRFGDNINTDDIIAGKYKHKTMDLDELSIHLMENIYPDFKSKVQLEDFIVAGNNFGCGSSREQAPQIIKHVGISAVIANSFARIFYRNAINIGLMLIQCDTSKIEDGDFLIYVSDKKLLLIPPKSITVEIPAVPKELIGIIEAGGLLNYVLEGGMK